MRFCLVGNGQQLVPMCTNVTYICQSLSECHLGFAAYRHGLYNLLKRYEWNWTLSIHQLISWCNKGLRWLDWRHSLEELLLSCPGAEMISLTWSLSVKNDTNYLAVFPLMSIYFSLTRPPRCHTLSYTVLTSRAGALNCIRTVSLSNSAIRILGCIAQ